MGADVLAMHGARASAAMIFIILNQINSVPAQSGLKDQTHITVSVHEHTSNCSEVNATEHIL